MIGGRFAILTVCTANICRSPLMEIVLRSRLDPQSFEVASAGVRGFRRHRMDAMAAMELMRLGHPEPSTFRSQEIADDLVQVTDLVLTATRAHRADVLDLSPLALRRTFTLLEFAGLIEQVDGSTPAELVENAARIRSSAPRDQDVADPYRRSPQVHRHTAEQIDEACERIARRLMATVAVAPPPRQVGPNLPPAGVSGARASLG